MSQSFISTVIRVKGLSNHIPSDPPAAALTADV